MCECVRARVSEARGVCVRARVSVECVQETRLSEGERGGEREMEREGERGGARDRGEGEREAERGRVSTVEHQCGILTIRTNNRIDCTGIPQPKKS